jgi:hypothetical protein
MPLEVRSWACGRERSTGSSSAATGSGLAGFAATFLHEVGHMASGTSEGTIDFENELSRLLGLAAAVAFGRSERAQ